MAVQVSLFEEHELSQFGTLAILSFERGLGHLITGPNTPENVDFNERKNLKAFKDPTVRYLKAVEVESGKIIAGAKWVIYPKGNTESELDALYTLPPTSTPTYKSELAPIYRRLNSCAREIMGIKPFFFLHLLFTHPEYYKRGAGKALTRWGSDRADELGIECYVESSIEGQALYEREGFVEVREESFDMGEFGRGDLGVDRVYLMVRPAREA